MNILRRTPLAEVRLAQQQRRHARISTATLQYMLEYGISHESWLRWQHGYLLGEAEEEADLYEALRLSERLNRVERNVGRVSSDNERLRSELLARDLEDG